MNVSQQDEIEYKQNKTMQGVWKELEIFKLNKIRKLG